MEFLNKAKEAIEKVEIKTEEFIYDRKCNLQLARLCSDLKKQYEKLGRLSYRKIKGYKIDGNEFDTTVENIELLKTEIQCLRDGKCSSAEFESIVFEDGEPVNEQTTDNE